MSQSHPAIIPRQGPDLGLDGDIPRFWLDGDPFKTRFFDAMSTLFPEGEKFFIACVRDFRDRITDPVLAAQVKDFMYQEGQHGMVHTRFNDRLAAQGVNMKAILDYQVQWLFGFFRKRCSPEFTLAMTVVAEHMTALMAHGFFRTGVMNKADPRIRAMYGWHAVEEIEHKAVAFDVMQKVAKVGYFKRLGAFLLEGINFPFHVFRIMSHMFDVDGIHGFKRARMWLRGFWWLYGWNGLYPRLLPHYFAFLLPGFHPWKYGSLEIYQSWAESYARTGDAIAASDAVVAAHGNA